MIQVEVPYGEVCPNKNIKVKYNVCKECGRYKSLSKTFVTCHLNKQALQTTKEQKELLLKDLCCRLPYSVMVRVEVNDVFIEPTDEVATFNTINMFEYPQKFRITPYLRPMSSMTEEEDKELSKIVWNSFWNSKDDYHASTALSDFCYEHHLDNHDLIPRGLALEAPEGMYNTK